MKPLVPSNTRSALLTALRDTARETKIEIERQNRIATAEMVPQEWRETPSSSAVIMRVCSLDQFTVNQTVANVAVNPFRDSTGGEIAVHMHDRFERIFVVEGEYTDPVSNKVYREGETQEIAPRQPHGLKSNFALLFVTWRPAYPRNEGV